MDTLTYTLPVDLSCSFDMERQKETAKSLKAQLEKFHANKILIHALSNNGHMLHQHILEEVSDTKVLGMIFDSCPGPMNLSSVFKMANYGNIEQYAKPSQCAFYLTYLHFQLSLQKAALFKAVSDTIGIRKQLRMNWKKYYPQYLSPMEHSLAYYSNIPALYLYSRY